MSWPGATYRVWFSPDEKEAPRELVAGRHFRMSFHGVSKAVYETLPLHSVDLLRVASAVYVVDRFIKRGNRSRPHGWFRSPRVTVEVMEPDFWNSRDVRKQLVECLDAVGSDGWEWCFARDPHRHVACYQRLLQFHDAPPPIVCLHSTGLDSTAGLARRIKAVKAEQFVPVLVRHQVGQAGLAVKQMRCLREHFQLSDEQLTPVMIGVRAYPSKMRSLGIADEENTQRCRSFLFASVGGVIATVMGASTVEIYESGIGAVNLPLMAGMVGSKATKGCHPKFLNLMSLLMTKVADRQITFRLPFLDRTKAEVVATLAEEGLHDLARSTVSCVHYPLREQPHKQCGVCPACLTRRQAMIVAGIEEPHDTYKFDLFGPPRMGREVVPTEERKFLNACLMQLEKLSGLESRLEVPSFFRRHLIGTGVVQDSESLVPFIRLYRRYREEWLPLVARARAQGWSWANLLTPRKVAV